jgi:opacity protein-like surface antigen
LLTWTTRKGLSMKRIIVLTVLSLMVLATPASAASWHHAAAAVSEAGVFAYVGGDVMASRTIQVGVTSYGAPHRVKWDGATTCYRGNNVSTRNKKGTVTVGKGRTKWITLRSGPRQDMCGYNASAKNASSSNHNTVLVRIRFK